MTVQGKSCLGEVSISPEIQWGIVLFESRLPTQRPAPANNITQGLETTGNGASQGCVANFSRCCYKVSDSTS